MTRPGIQEPSSKNRRNSLYINHFYTNLPRSLPGTLQDLARMQAVRSTEQEDTVRRARPDAQVIGKRHDTAPAVAAHHAAGPVRIVEFHRKIFPGIAGSQNHQSVRPELTAQRFDARRRTAGGHILLPAVQNDEIVSGS